MDEQRNQFKPLYWNHISLIISDSVYYLFHFQTKQFTYLKTLCFVLYHFKKKISVNVSYFVQKMAEAEQITVYDTTGDGQHPITVTMNDDGTGIQYITQDGQGVQVIQPDIVVCS